MPSTFETEFTALSDPILEEEYSILVTYRRGELSVSGVVAFHSEAESLETTAEGTQVLEHGVLFEIKPARLDDLEGGRIEPMSGDIIETEDGTCHDVTTGFEDAVWRWSTPDEKHYEIFTLRRGKDCGC